MVAMGTAFLAPDARRGLDPTANNTNATPRPRLGPAWAGALEAREQIIGDQAEVAQHLLKTVMAARLLGAEWTISGIRPQIAHAAVSLGIEFGDIAVYQPADVAVRAARGRRGDDRD